MTKFIGKAPTGYVFAAVWPQNLKDKFKNGCSQPRTYMRARDIHIDPSVQMERGEESYLLGHIVQVCGGKKPREWIYGYIPALAAAMNFNEDWEEYFIAAPRAPKLSFLAVDSNGAIDLRKARPIPVEPMAVSSYVANVASPPPRQSE